MKANIKPVSPGKWRLDVVVKKDGKQYRKRVTVVGTKREAELRYWEVRKELGLEAEGEAERSLKNGEIKFADILDLYVKRGSETIGDGLGVVRGLDRPGSERSLRVVGVSGLGADDAGGR